MRNWSKNTIREASKHKLQKHIRLMVPLCMKLGSEKEAFEYVEGSKSRVFLELLAATKIKPTVEPTREKDFAQD